MINKCWIINFHSTNHNVDKFYELSCGLLIQTFEDYEVNPLVKIVSLKSTDTATGNKLQGSSP